MQGIAGISPSPGCRAEKLVARDVVLVRRVARYTRVHCIYERKIGKIAQLELKAVRSVALDFRSHGIK